MFDFDISLFMLRMCNTILRYCDCSHVSIEFLCSHVYMIVKLTCLRTKVDIRTVGWWMYRLQSGNTEGIRGLGMYRGMITSIDTVTQVSIEFRRKQAKKNVGISIEHNTNNTHENGNKCVPIWKRREVRIHV